MNPWRDMAGEGFPPPREDEPAQLRRDIADELADHLALAMDRELHKTSDEASARRAVLTRFGDPARLARRLWLEAMKEKIMKDRIVMGAIVVLTVAALAAAAFTWTALRQSQQANQAMLAALEKLSAQTPTVGSTDLATAKIRVVGETSGKPVKGVPVRLNGHPFNETTPEETIRQLCDETGTTVFGPLRPGNYHLDIVLGDLLTEYWPNLYGGRTLEQTFQLPDAKPANVTLLSPLPDDLKDKGLFVGYDLLGKVMRPDNESWEERHRIGVGPDHALYGFNVAYDNRKQPREGFLYQQLKAKSESIPLQLQDQAVYGISIGIPPLVSKGDENQYKLAVEYKNPNGPIQEFQIHAGKTETIEIPMPPELIEEVRQALREAAPEPKQSL